MDQAITLTRQHLPIFPPQRKHFLPKKLLCCASSRLLLRHCYWYYLLQLPYLRVKDNEQRSRWIVQVAQWGGPGNGAAPVAGGQDAGRPGRSNPKDRRHGRT